jgi:hypothetical protein
VADRPVQRHIAHGVAAGSLTGNPFDPLANSTVQDGDINAALDKRHQRDHHHRHRRQCVRRRTSPSRKDAAIVRSK